MGLFTSLIGTTPKIPRSNNWDPEIKVLPEPPYVVIPLEYPGRILYKPLVKVGDKVRKYQIIGKSERGHCVHSSISGEVKDILMVWTPLIYNVPAVLIQKTEDPPMEVEEIFHQYGKSFAYSDHLERLKIMGVISPWTRPGRFAEEGFDKIPRINKVIIKGHDEESTVTVNELLLRQKVKEIKNGIQKAAVLSPHAEIILTVSEKLVDWAKSTYKDNVRIVGVPDNYTARIQQMLIPKIAGVKIPPTEPYMSRGIAVIAVEYLLNAVNALEGVSPFIYKYLTVSGEGMEKAITVRFPIGTTIRYILENLGIKREKLGRIIFGGPMRGNSQYTELTPLTKTGHGLYFMEKEKVPSEANHTCLNCGRCTEVCPLNLQIHLIGRMVEFDMCADAAEYHPEMCIKCGLCGYVCPAHRPLVQFIQMYKKFHGLAHEPNHKEIECSGKSTLEGWELRLRNSSVVDSGVNAGING